jgi:excinuclease Cho
LPGVYTFHGEEGDLPLYIGKSVNIRNRVLSHLRTPAEARLLRQTRRISCIRTAGEIGALLLEARLIKTLHPLHNQRLRMSKQLFAWRFTEGVPALVNAKEVNFARESGLFGLYASRHSAEQQLRNLADEQRLCYGLLRLEKPSTGRPCFRAQLKQCLGACCGRETVEEHRSRLALALQDLNVVCWPFPGAVALVEHQADLKDIHVVQNWCYLGTVPTMEAAKSLISVHASFDADSYKILCRPIVGAAIQIISL